MDCQELVERLYPYLDRELTPEEVREVGEHLGECPSCLELVRFESGVIKLVRRECVSDRAPAGLRERVHSILRP